MPDLLTAGRYQIGASFEDLEYGEGPHWRFAHYSDPSYPWHEACARVLRLAAEVCHEEAVMTVTGGVAPCDLGCMEDDGTPIPPGRCGEPGTARFRVEVRDDTTRHTWFVC